MNTSPSIDEVALADKDTVYVVVNYVGFNIIAVCRTLAIAKSERIKYQEREHKPTVIIEKELL